MVESKPKNIFHALLGTLILTHVSLLPFFHYFVLYCSYSAEEKDPEELEENDYGDEEEDEDDDEK